MQVHAVWDRVLPSSVVVVVRLRASTLPTVPRAVHETVLHGGWFCRLFHPHRHDLAPFCEPVKVNVIFVHMARSLGFGRIDVRGDSMIRRVELCDGVDVRIHVVHNTMHETSALGFLG